MNGIHDMGGMHGMGALIRERDEPVFHEPWEGRVYALTRAMRTRGGVWNLDTHRHALERIPPADYLRLTYYERWFEVLRAQVIAVGDATEEEVESGVAVPGSARQRPFVTADAVPSMVGERASARRSAAVAPTFAAGQHVRARNIHPVGHTRLPRYVRGKVGLVSVDRGVFLFPDTHAHLQGEKPQHLYSVRFAARELWGDQASPRDFVHLDLWDDYLERA